MPPTFRKVFNPLLLFRFNYHKETKKLTAEASSLVPANTTWIHSLYVDAADVGIAIYSDKTGKTEHFYLHDIQKDNEGDILCWVFHPVNPNLDTVREVVVYND